MKEQSKALPRRLRDREFQRYFDGVGLDIGANPDPLSQTALGMFPITFIISWNVEDGDAQKLPGLKPQSYDFVFASHVLEHLEDPFMALDRWVEVTKIGGHLIITLPDWEMYERQQWPSRFSGEHKWAFSMELTNKHQVIYMPILSSYSPYCRIERMMVIRDGFNPDLPRHVDQTLGPAECAIELVLQRLK